MFRFILLTLLFPLSFCLQAQNQNNVLLIIADDWGLDYCNGYYSNPLNITTPTLDSLRNVGLTFDNVWASPKCTPTRANIMSGKYGVKTGVLKAPGNLDTIHTSVFNAIKGHPNNTYKGAVVGKWHISQPANPAHPQQHDTDYYMGLLDAAPSDYSNWNKTSNQQTTIDTNYVTTVFTDSSIHWINNQNQPWVMWLAHVTPHTPYHLPPAHMYNIANTGTNRRKYIAMIESFDYEINRLLYSIPDSVRDNTTIIIIGDNGSNSTVLNNYPTGHGKTTLYQGGIHIPMIVAGKNVTRINQREAALIHVVDIHATILELTGDTLAGGVNNSLSFKHLLSGTTGDTRDYNYAEIKDPAAVEGWTIRDQQYKLIEYDDGTQEFFDLLIDTFEFNNLLDSGLTLNPTQQTIKADLEAEAAQIRAAWSCRDYIQNGDETGIDCGGTYCPSCATLTTKLVAEENKIQIYPNPSYHRLIIQSSTENQLQSIQIIDVCGRELLSFDNINNFTFEADLSTLPSQVYFAKITLANQAIISKKIIKQ